jgi:hypothetical protein
MTYRSKLAAILAGTAAAIGMAGTASAADPPRAVHHDIGQPALACNGGAIPLTRFAAGVQSTVQYEATVDGVRQGPRQWSFTENGTITLPAPAQDGAQHTTSYAVWWDTNGHRGGDPNVTVVSFTGVCGTPPPQAQCISRWDNLRLRAKRDAPRLRRFWAEMQGHVFHGHRHHGRWDTHVSFAGMAFPGNGWQDRNRTSVFLHGITAGRNPKHLVVELGFDPCTWPKIRYVNWPARKRAPLAARQPA